MATRTLYHIVDGTVTTTDNATQQPLATFDISTGAPGGGALNNCSLFVFSNATAYDTTSNTSAGSRQAALFKVVGGTLTQVGATNNVVNMIRDMTAAASGFSVSGTTITFWVTGTNAETAVWFGRMEINIHQPV